jgi:hypothetical protein
MQHITQAKSAASLHTMSNTRLPGSTNGNGGNDRLTDDERREVAGGNRLVALLAMILLCGFGAGAYLLVRFVVGLFGH